MAIELFQSDDGLVWQYQSASPVQEPFTLIVIWDLYCATISIPL